MQQLWQSLQERKEASLHENLNALYSELLSKWQLEMGWCLQVFSLPLGMLVKVFGESMNVLSSSLGQSLHGVVHKSQEPVKALIELRHVSDRIVFDLILLSLSLSQIVLKFLKNFSKSFQSTDISSTSVFGMHITFIILLTFLYSSF